MLQLSKIHVGQAAEEINYAAILGKKAVITKRFEINAQI